MDIHLDALVDVVGFDLVHQAVRVGVEQVVRPIVDFDGHDVVVVLVVLGGPDMRARRSKFQALHKFRSTL